MKERKFKLSASGKLALIITMTLSPLSLSYGSHIVPVENTANSPTLSKHVNNSTVVNIVAPSASGLSHNQYKEFNVNQQGITFNNLTYEAELNSNPNLINGRPATLILNEVVGVNISELQGRQQLAGSPADYILANRNGINCDGCSFDPQFNQVSLAVGEAIVNQGKFEKINTVDGKGSLNINASGAYWGLGKNVNLIAPNINSDRDISIDGNLNIVLGHNHVNSDGNVIYSVEPKNNSYIRDAILAGSMNANRIRVFDNHHDRKIKLKGDNIISSNDIDIDVNSKLMVHSDSLHAGSTLKIKANNINVANNVESPFRNNQVELTDISAGENIVFSANGNINLTSVNIKAKKDVSLNGGEINITAGIKSSSTDDYDREYTIGFTDIYSTSSTSIDKVIKNSINTDGNVRISATDGDVTAGALLVNAGNELNVSASGSINTHGISGLNVNRKHIRKVDSLFYAEKDKNNKLIKRQFLEKNHFFANKNMNLNARDNINLTALTTHAGGDLFIHSDGTVNINVQKTKNTEIDNYDKDKFFEIGGENKDNHSDSYEISHRTELTGRDIHITSGNNMQIFGAKIDARRNSNIEAGKALFFGGAINERREKGKKVTTGIFDIPFSSNQKDNSYEAFVDSQITTGGDLVARGDTVQIEGSIFDINNHLSIHSDNDITVIAAREQQKKDEQSTQLSMGFYSEESDKNQYNAGFMIKYINESEKSTHNNSKTSTLKAGDIDISAGGDLLYYGTAIETTAGNLTINADKNVGFFAARNNMTSDKNTKITSGGFYYTGGIDRAGSGISVSHQDHEENSSSDSGIVSRTDIKGSLLINAKGDITHQGAQHKVTEEYHAQGGTINNLASNNIYIDRSNHEKWNGGLGFNIDYSGITRPIRKSLEKKLETEGLVIPNAKPPTAGMDITLNKKDTDKSDKKIVAYVTTIHAGKGIVEHATGTMIDEATQYNSAGAIKITANDYFNNTAEITSLGHQHDIHGQGKLRVATSSGKDIKISLKGQGGVNISDYYTQDALPGIIQAKDGVSIDIINDGYFQATQIEGGNNDVIVNAGNQLNLDQSQYSEINGLSNAFGKGGLKLDSKAGANGGLIEGGGGMHRQNKNANNAMKTRITTEGKVKLASGNGDLTLKGVEIGSVDAAVADVELISGGKVKLLASVSDSATQASKQGGSVLLGMTKSSSGDKNTTSGAIGVTAEENIINESTLFSQGSYINSRDNIIISAGSYDEKSIYTQGLEAIAPYISMTAENGGIFMESARSSSPKDNKNLYIGISENGEKTSGSNSNSINGYDVTGGSFNLISANENQTIIKHENTKLTANIFKLSSAGDTKMKGAKVIADIVRADIGGNLKIQSVEEHEKINKSDIRFNLGYMGNVDSDKDAKFEFGGAFDRSTTEQQGIKEKSGFSGKYKNVINYDGHRTLFDAEVINSRNPVEWNTFSHRPSRDELYTNWLLLVDKITNY
ncbi:hypothetical protein A9Q62_09270 [Yersinia ruckeri]|uniref:hemagglutinin repeat-containing protein n=1 Tax=Yersinia ruckeri TaxID=29486 RepID=UPI0008FE2C46|nr:hemagglutinin repeat-containing protein [Yersinia ruckeri]OJB82703.1 hypothetical protein A9Q62_09270 [Yersinia ruckeri]OJB89404.1 hypothetical protein A9Q60_09025 [Yersinia ruckeri]